MFKQALAQSIKVLCFILSPLIKVGKWLLKPMVKAIQPVLKPLITVMVFTSIFLAGMIGFSPDKAYANSVSETKIAGSSVFLHIDLVGGGWVEADPLGMGKYTINNNIGFCVEPHDFNFSRSGHTITDFPSTHNQVYESKIVYYSWDTSAKTDRDYFVTNLILWDEIMNNLRPTVHVEGVGERQYNGGYWTASLNGVDYSSNSAAYQQAKAEVMAKVNGTVNFDKTEVTLKPGQSETVTDLNGFLQYLHLRENSSNTDVQHHGNQVTITAREDSVDGKLAFRKTNAVYDGNTQATLFYKGAGGQDLATFKLVDPAGVALRVNVIKNGTLVLGKRNANTQEMVPGTVFEISANPDMSYSQTFTTGDTGYTQPLSFEAKMYYYREVSVPSPLLVDTTIKQINLEAGQSYEVVVDNQVAQGKLKLIKQDTNTSQFLSGAVFSVKNARGEEVAQLTTGQDGRVTSDLLPLGTYTVQEISAPQGYLLDETVHTVTLSYLNQETPVVLESLALTNDQIPTIKTKAFFLDGTKESHSEETLGIVDVISYQNLVVGKTYSFYTELADALTKEVVFEGTVEFTAKSIDGEVKVPIVIPHAQRFMNHQFVVLEDLLLTGRVIAQHRDYTDKDQTVKITTPEIKTTASVVDPLEDVFGKIVFKDTVCPKSDKPLIVGKEYTVKGQLMDGINQQPLLDEAGQLITAQRTFVAQKPDECVELSFLVNRSQLAKGKVVVFETLYEKEKQLSVHADYEDKGQTIELFEIEVKKVDANDQSKVLKQAEFTLYQNGVALETKRTDENGIVRFVVAKGEYSVKETDAPAGYQLSKDEIKVNVDGLKSDFVYPVIALNKVIALPKMGQTSTLLERIEGGSFIGIALVLLIKKEWI